MSGGVRAKVVAVADNDGGTDQHDKTMAYNPDNNPAELSSIFRFGRPSRGVRPLLLNLALHADGAILPVEELGGPLVVW